MVESRHLPSLPERTQLFFNFIDLNFLLLPNARDAFKTSEYVFFLNPSTHSRDFGLQSPEAKVRVAQSLEWWTFDQATCFCP